MRGGPRLLLRLALVALCAAGLASLAPGDARAACAPDASHPIRFAGSRYVPVVVDPPPLGAVVGRGRQEGCDDGNGGTPDRDVEVRALAGVDPTVAVGLAEAPGLAYALEGTFPSQADHPLHNAVGESRAAGDCARPTRRFEAIVRFTSPGALLVRARYGDGALDALEQDGLLTVAVDASTDLSAFSGLARVAPDDVLEVDARTCGSGSSSPNALLAQRLVPLGHAEAPFLPGWAWLALGLGLGLGAAYAVAATIAVRRRRSAARSRP